MRLIDADALFAEFENAKWYDNNDRDLVAEDILMDVPTVDPVKHGKWNDTYKSGYMPVPRNVCSVCDCWGERRSDYCPNCGAKMNDNAGVGGLSVLEKYGIKVKKPKRS